MASRRRKRYTPQYRHNPRGKRAPKGSYMYFVGNLARKGGVQTRAKRIDMALQRANRRGFIAGLNRR